MKITFTKQALKDMEKIKKIPALRKKVLELIRLVGQDPLKRPPDFEKLEGDLAGLYSRRINIQHRLVYEILSDEVKIYRMWTHYE